MIRVPFVIQVPFVILPAVLLFAAVLAGVDVVPTLPKGGLLPIDPETGRTRLVGQSNGQRGVPSGAVWPLSVATAGHTAPLDVGGRDGPFVLT